MLLLEDRVVSVQLEEDSHDVTCRDRLPGWVADRVVPLLGALVLVTDVVAALILLLAPREEFRSVLFSAARTVAPLETWGAVLLVLVAFVALTWWVQGRCKVGGFLLAVVLGLGFWSFWTVLAAWSSFGPNGATGLLAAFSGSLGAGHVLAGFAWPCRRRLRHSPG